MQQLLVDRAAAIRMRCPSCGEELGDFPASPADPIRCRRCEYSVTWEQDCWDACVDKTYRRDFARQWILWEAGKLGDPNVIYGVSPEDRFREFLNLTGLSPEQLKSMRILEVGFGHGRLLKELQKWCPMAYGLDLSRPLRSARLRPGSAIFGNLLSIPFMPHQFDLVICRGVIHMTPDAKRAFNCVAEQVAPGGMFYMGGLYEPGKGNLVLRKIFPGIWNYPEFARLAVAHLFSPFRAALETVRSRKPSWKAFKRSCAHYKLDIFDVICPRWTSVHMEDEVLGWFLTQGFVGRKVGYGDYVGISADRFSTRQ